MSAALPWIDDRVIDNHAPHPVNCRCTGCARDNADSRQVPR